MGFWGKWISEWLEGLGQLTLLTREAIGSVFTFKVAWRDFLYQFYFIGVKSQSVVLITGAFTGMVLGAQTSISIPQGQDGHGDPGGGERVDVQ